MSGFSTHPTHICVLLDKWLSHDSVCPLCQAGARVNRIAIKDLHTKQWRTTVYGSKEVIITSKSAHSYSCFQSRPSLCFIFLASHSEYRAASPAEPHSQYQSYHWTRSSARSIHLSSTHPISLGSTLMLSSCRLLSDKGVSKEICPAAFHNQLSHHAACMPNPSYTNNDWWQSINDEGYCR